MQWTFLREKCNGTVKFIRTTYGVNGIVGPLTMGFRRFGLVPCLLILSIEFSDLPFIMLTCSNMLGGT